MALPEIKLTNYAPGLIKPRDYTIAQNAIKTLVDRHDKTLEQMGNYQQALGQILERVNPSEAINVTNRFNQYMDRIKEHIDTRSGYAGNALGAALQIGKEAAGDYYFIGRMKYQADREKDKERYKQMAANGLISEGMVDMWDEENPYNYIDIRQGETEESARRNRVLENEYNENPELYLQNHNGEIPKSISDGTVNNTIVNGSQWKSNTSLVKSVNLSDLWDKAAERVKIQGGGSTKLIYKTADGRETYNSSEADPDNPYPWYIDSNGNTVTIKEEDLKKAMRSIIAETPGARESIEQDLRYGIYRTGKDFKNIDGAFVDENGKVIDNEYTDEYGQKLSYDKYLDSLINPAARQMAKHIGTYSRTPSAGIEYDSKLRIENAKAINKGTKSSAAAAGTALENLMYAPAVPSEMRQMEVDGLASQYQALDNSLNTIFAALDSSNVKYNKNDSIEELWNKLPTTSKTPELWDAYNLYHKTSAYIALNPELIGDKEISDAVQFTRAIEGGYSITDDNNQFYNNYKTKVDAVFTDDNGNTIDKIYIPMFEDKRGNPGYTSGKGPNYGTPYRNDYTEKIKEYLGDKVSYYGKYIVVDSKDKDILGFISKSVKDAGLQPRTYHMENGSLVEHGKSFIPFIGNYSSSLSNLEDIYTNAINTKNKVTEGDIARYVDDGGRFKSLVEGETTFVPIGSIGQHILMDDINGDTGSATMITNMQKMWKTAVDAYSPANNELFVSIGHNPLIQIKDPTLRSQLWDVINDEHFNNLKDYGYDKQTLNPKLLVKSNADAPKKSVFDIANKLKKVYEALGYKFDSSDFSSILLEMPDVDKNDNLKKAMMSHPSFRGSQIMYNSHLANANIVPVNDSIRVHLNGGSPFVTIGNSTTPVYLDNPYNTTGDREYGAKLLLGYSENLENYEKQLISNTISEADFVNYTYNVFAKVFGYEIKTDKSNNPVLVPTERTNVSPQQFNTYHDMYLKYVTSHYGF